MLCSLRKAPQGSHRLAEKLTSDDRPARKGEYISNGPDPLNTISGLCAPAFHSTPREHRWEPHAQVALPSSSHTQESLTCSGIIRIFVWMAGEGLLPICLLHLEESENMIIHSFSPTANRKTLLKR